VGACVEGDDGTLLLIDTPPELRLQLLASNIRKVDALFFTHDHADHVNGLDDIRAVTNTSGGLPVYAAPDVIERLETRFPYVFDATLPLPGTSKPKAVGHPLKLGETVSVGALTVAPVEVNHGPMIVYGYRIGPLGYVTDAKSLPAASKRALRGVKVLVLNALFRTPHPTHLSVSESVALALEIGAERTFLTHLTHRTSHAELERELPSGIAPAYDGLTVTID
jgi:Metal-dependent hydrolases of the beta-lactamase superfamily I